MAEQDDILRKIQRCLALANDKRGDQNTSAIALRQAQKLMETYNISHTAVLASQVSEIDIRSKVAVVNPSQWEVNAIHFICEAFGCKHLWTKGGPEPTKKGYWSILGPKMQVQVCEYAWVVTMRELLKARNEFVRKLTADRALCELPRKIKSKMADSFCMGWGYAIREKISVFADPDGLIAAANAAHMAEKHPNAAKSEVKKNHFRSNELMNMGASAASSFSLHRPMDQNEGSQPLRIGS